MTLHHLVLREIGHRKLNFVLSMVSVAVAVACVVGSETLLRLDRVVTADILGRKQAEIEQRVADRRAEVEQAGAALQDEIRKSMLGLGFNVLILPEGQDLTELHLDGTLSETMPENYVDRLANSDIVTVNHLLPSVTQRIHWDEHDLDVILTGTRGEVPIMHRGLKKPLLDAVEPGKMVVGSEIHQRLGLSEGDRVTLMGKEFTISTLHPPRGSSDDVTIWIDLGQAQELLGLENLIHAILALECDCAGDRLAMIRAEISAILPGTKVIERYSQALARAEARTQAKETAEQALEQELRAGDDALQHEAAGRAEIERRREQFAGVLVPFAVLAAAVWVGLLAFGNARQRSGEIGILRAIGLRSRQILTAFLTKAVLVGLGGAILGALLGLVIGLWVGQGTSTTVGLRELNGTGSFAVVLVFSLLFAPLLSVVASWLPAILVSRRDPATVLHAD
ncbi:ABC transporter permease [Tautonia marina]|uniref:ABC transporter permease n=1 Tax=Tautonia marina TaxID=2653855 RepID=UPI001260730D|nr:FtsX-like permease family protein [Tautonia marina]